MMKNRRLDIVGTSLSVVCEITSSGRNYRIGKATLSHWSVCQYWSSYYTVVFEIPHSQDYKMFGAHILQLDKTNHITMLACMCR